MKKIFFLFLICFLIFALCSCEKEKERFTDYSFDYFDTATTIVGFANSKEEFDTVVAEIKTQLGEYHKLYTIYNRYDGLNNLRIINVTEGEVEVDSRIIDMLLFSKEMYSLTGGKTNIAMGSVLSIWHSYRDWGSRHPEEAELPPMDKLFEASAYTDIESIKIDKEKGTVERLDGKVTLDVGAIAKGYAVARVADYLREKGIEGYLLNVGGNVCTIGARPDGTKWSVGVENPTGDESEPYVAYLSLAGESVVTSGAYQRYYFVDGERYHHIIDPETLMPGVNYLSVSVICLDSGVGDALSTALFCMDIDEGQKLVENTENVEAMWILQSGERIYSSGFKNYTYK